MSLSIAGMSWIAPLGSGVADVWKRLVAGEAAPVETLENEQNGARYLVRRFQPSWRPIFPPLPHLPGPAAISHSARPPALPGWAKRRSPPPPTHFPLASALP